MSKTGGQKPRGMSFVSDFGKMGQGPAITRTSGGDFVLEEEKRLIDKVFDIIDRDQSGSIDTSELVEMFTNMGMEQATTTAVERIMQNVDKDHSEAISREEFYSFLSSKLSKNDKREEIQAVFNQFARKQGQNKEALIGANELKDVATQLGENLSMAEIKDMLDMFANNKTTMNFDDFHALMISEIPGEDQMAGDSSLGKGASGTSLGSGTRGGTQMIGGHRASSSAAFSGGVSHAQSGVGTEY